MPKGKRLITKAALHLSIGLFFALTLSLTAPTASAATTQELQQLILQLQEQVLQLQQQLQSLQGIPSTSQQAPTITRTLRLGSRDANTNGEVSKLQQFLAGDPTIYPEGLITGYFGSLTEKAVQRWQARNGVVSSGSPATTGYGTVGPQTRAKIREATFSSGITPSSPAFGGGGGGGGGGGSTGATPAPVSTATSRSASEDALQVRLIPSVRSGIAPVSGVHLTADVLGTAQGAINYTFYCNRSDAGVNITTPYSAKFDNQTDTRKTAANSCSYSSPGSYHAKVIVERGNLKAEIREIVTVTSPATTPASQDSLQVRLTPSVRSGVAPISDVDLTADVLGKTQGAINYTFYCNRSDAGTNITSPWAQKFDHQTDTRKTAVDACSYSSPGSYYTKVIVERGNLKAEIREIITVSAPAPPPISTPPSPSSYSVTSSITNGQSLSGSVTWTAVPSDIAATQKVEFWIDDVLKWTEDISPYYFNGDNSTLDTTALSDGSHSFTVKAYSTSGGVSQTAVTATVDNGGSSATNTFGVTTVLPNPHGSLTNNKRVVKAQLSERGEITQLKMYIEPQNIPGTELIRGVIYDDNGLGGDPGTLLAVSNEIQITSTSGNGWKDLILAAPITLEPGTYWIGDHRGGQQNLAWTRKGACNQCFKLTTDTYSDGTATSFGSTQTFSDVLLSIYAVYRPTTVPPTPPPPPPPSYSVTSSVTNGQSLSGSVTWTAVPSDIAATQKVEFLIDNVLKWTENVSPYYFNGNNNTLDTTTLTNGTHTFTVKAYSTSGQTAQVSVNATVSNAVPAPPPPSGSGNILWRGDFETNNFSQFSCGVQAKTSGRVTIATDILRQGKYASRFHVEPGDNNVAGSGSGERAEVCGADPPPGTDIQEGKEQWYAWSTYFPSDFVGGDGWNFWTQFHNQGATGQANMGFNFVNGGTKLNLRVFGGNANAPTIRNFAMADLQRNKWYDIVFHVKWSSTSTGFIEIWVNGVRTVPLTNTPTLYAGQTAYWKQGYYRGANSQPTTLYHDGARLGDSYQAVISEFPNWPGIIPAPTSFVPETGRFYLTRAEIDVMKQNIATKGWAQNAWQNTKAAADAALSAGANVPDPTKDYRERNTADCSGESRGWHNCLYIPGLNDGHQARNLALAYAVTGDSRYADASKRILMGWAQRYNPSPPSSKIGHMIAEPVGFMLKGFMAYDLVKEKFSDSERATFQSWSQQFVTKGKSNADSARDNPWAPDTTICGQVTNAAPYGNSATWTRSMAVLAAAVVGGQTLTDTLKWNWQHTTAKGKDYGWDNVIDNSICASGQMIEEVWRQTISYGLYSWHPLALIADVSKHVPVSGLPNLWTATTPSGKHVARVTDYYEPYLTRKKPSPWATDLNNSNFDAGVLGEYRAAMETVYKNRPESTTAKSIVTFGGDSLRGVNRDAHISGYNAVLGEIFSAGY